MMATQGTEDATKWNECVSPAAFATMHFILFEDSTRIKMGLPISNENGKLFSEIAILCNFFQAWKEIQLGPGVIVEGKGTYARLEWKPEDRLKMNTRTRAWYDKLCDKISDDGLFVQSSPGMLMGMLNAGSTTLGMLPANYRMNKMHMKVVYMRSSDDSMTYIFPTSWRTTLYAFRKTSKICLWWGST